MALIIGNWKMNGLTAGLAEVRAIAEGAADLDGVVICPPATLLKAVSDLVGGTAIRTGGQDCHPAACGAHTGRISAEMIADAGGSYCIVGHSECRAECGDTDAVLRAKAEATLRAGLVPVFCVGEGIGVRRSGGAEDFVLAQLEVVADLADRIVVAYEPVWAIGTGEIPSPGDIAAMHHAMRARLGPTPPLLYGGSVKPSNAAAILAIDEVGGVLVGGASLHAEEFLAIARAA